MSRKHWKSFVTNLSKAKMMKLSSTNRNNQQMLADLFTLKHCHTL